MDFWSGRLRSMSFTFPLHPTWKAVATLEAGQPSEDHEETSTPQGRLTIRREGSGSGGKLPPQVCTAYLTFPIGGKTEVHQVKATVFRMYFLMPNQTLNNRVTSGE